jgi:hypothetical protein
MEKRRRKISTAISKNFYCHIYVEYTESFSLHGSRCHAIIGDREVGDRAVGDKEE